MKISQRVQNLKLSPIRKLAPYADAAKKAGKKVYHLNIGQPDIETPPQFMDAIKNFDEKVIAYGASKGEPFLIEAIQKYYAEKLWLCATPMTKLWFLNRFTPTIQLLPPSSALKSTP